MRNFFLISTILLLSLNNLFSQEVKFSLDPKTELWGLSKGSTWLIKPKYTHWEDFDTQGFAKVGERPEYSYDIYWGLIDKYGNEIVRPKYMDIGHFNYERAWVKNEKGFYGYIDKNGNEVIATKYTYADNFSLQSYGTVAIVAYAENPRRQDRYYIDITGKIIFPNEVKTYFHKNMRASARGTEKNGKKTGIWEFWNEDGYLISIEGYNNEGLADGSYRHFFSTQYDTENSYPPQTETGTFKNGKKDGLIIFYHPMKGKRTYTELWENGMFKKVKDIYDINGNLISSTGTGTVVWYKENSEEIAGKIEYQNGHKAGFAVWYHPNTINSQIRQKALYKYDADDVNGLRWEILEINDRNGKPLPKGTLKNGNGTWISYDDYDKPTIITTYQNGKKVKEEKALVKDIDNIYNNINNNANTNPYAEIALSNEPYEQVCVRNELASQRYKEAFQCAKSGDEKGIAFCTATLGFLYHNGLGTEKDFSKAFQHYKKAAELGSAEAMYYLGLMYYNGEYVKKDGLTAVKWVGKSAQQKIPEAMDLMSRIYYSGFPEAGIAINYEKALDYAIDAKASYKNDPEFINHLAYCYFLSGNKKMAYGILSDLVKSHPNYANGFDSLGEVGWSLGFKEQAIENYKKAAKMGHENAIKWCKNNNVTY